MSPLRRSTAPPAKAPSLSLGPCRSTRTPIGRPVSSSSDRIIATRSRMTSCEAWLMLMRKTSAPAANKSAIVSRSLEAGPRVAMILTRRRRACTSCSSHDRRLPPCSFLPGRGREPASADQGFAWSVSCTVQLLASLPVSTSKKPVRLKPRTKQSCRPTILNSRSDVHMKTLPFHSPPRSSIA